MDGLAETIKLIAGAATIFIVWLSYHSLRHWVRQAARDDRRRRK